MTDTPKRDLAADIATLENAYRALANAAAKALSEIRNGERFDAEETLFHALGEKEEDS